MFLSHISLINFRSYKEKEFHLSPQLSIIVGPNTAGKTNLLEAIFLVSTGKSFRADSDREMIIWGKEIGRVTGEIVQLSNNPINQLSNEKKELEVVLTAGIVAGVKAPFKKFSVNGVGRRMIDFVGNLKTVLFWPEDLELVISSPTLRRRYLDFVLTQTDREYRRSLISYEKGLRQRNRLLEAIRDGGAHQHQLIFWDQLLIKDGEYITKKREEYIEYINKFKVPFDLAQGGQKAKLKTPMPQYNLVYDRSIISRLRLDQYKEAEVASGATVVGPHRDDFKFKINPPAGGEKFKMNDEYTDLSRYGSRGEQRLAILWLKLAELSYIENISGEKAVLLLDDIFSELDHEHRRIIFDIIGNQQTIMTTTDMHFIEKDLAENVKIIEL